LDEQLWCRHRDANIPELSPAHPAKPAAVAAAPKAAIATAASLSATITVTATLTAVTAAVTAATTVAAVPTAKPTIATLTPPEATVSYFGIAERSCVRSQHYTG
jgi:hypothetical protein